MIGEGTEEIDLSTLKEWIYGRIVAEDVETAASRAKQPSTLRHREVTIPAAPSTCISTTAHSSTCHR